MMTLDILEHYGYWCHHRFTQAFIEIYKQNFYLGAFSYDDFLDKGNIFKDLEISQSWYADEPLLWC